MFKALQAERLLACCVAFDVDMFGLADHHLRETLQNGAPNNFKLQVFKSMFWVLNS